MSNRVRLGKTELLVSPICFGTWQLSPFWGNPPEDPIMRAMRRGFELGVNFFDTADAYGDGYSEQVVGKALKDLPREKVVVATKVFHRYDANKQHLGDLSHDYVLSACDASLKRLGMDYIDLYQCHSYEHRTHPQDTAAALEKLVKQGKVRAYGVSNWSVEQMRLGRRHGAFHSCQPSYSLMNRRIEADLLPYCLAEDIGVLVYSPLHLGLLSGKYHGDETFTDQRQNRPDFTGERFREICNQVQSCRPLADKYNLTLLQLVLAVTLGHPGVTCTIVGIKSPDQIEEAAGAMGKSISHDDWYEVRRLIQG